MFQMSMFTEEMQPTRMHETHCSVIPQGCDVPHELPASLVRIKSSICFFFNHILVQLISYSVFVVSHAEVLSRRSD